VTLQELARRKDLEFRVVDVPKDVLSFCDIDTRVIGITLASNVTGEILPVREISKGKNAALLIVDATAAIGHIPLHVHDLGADVLYFSGHKMLGPTGIGVLWVKKSLLELLRPSIFGGNMVTKVNQETSQWSDIPARFEPGTPNIAGVIGLGNAVDYLTMLDVAEIHSHIQCLVLYTQDKLSAIPGVTLYSALPEENVGNIAFTVTGIHPHDIADILARHEVKVRAGHHCAMPLHAVLGQSATVRVSLHCYSAKEDIDRLAEAIQDAIKIFAH
jgi:cysteine desulfurase/selenocysteine lyase